MISMILRMPWSVRGRQHYFCSLQGILRIIEIILVLLVLILARVGAKGNQLNFGSTDADFIGVGGSIFLTITLLMFTVSNLIGHLPPTLLEVMTTLVGSVLMITAGALAVNHYSGYSYTRNYHYEAGLALGVTAIITGIVLAVDFILSLRTMKISIG